MKKALVFIVILLSITLFGFTNKIDVEKVTTFNTSMNDLIPNDKVGYVDIFIKKFMKENNGTLKSFFDAKNLIISFTIDNVFNDNKIPIELKYLAFIESNFNRKARSNEGAVGLWQFTIGTGKTMGLCINGKKDERRDIELSTIAAAKYLNSLHDQFGDWLLVVAAYNCGAGKIQRELDKTGGTIYWDIEKRLPLETQKYVMKFIAMYMILDNAPQYIDLGSFPEDYTCKFEKNNNI